MLVVSTFLILIGKKHVNVNGGANTFVKPALSENERINDTGKALYNIFLFTLFLF